MGSAKNLEYKDNYVQSANSLFHFMKEERFLTKSIERGALVPRYCKEDIEYMNLKNPRGEIMKEMVVLQKCFCDIPFHKISEKFAIEIVNEKEISEETTRKVDEREYNTHIGCYGEYGLVFSKEWCVTQGFQPVLYVNTESEYLQQLKDLFTHIMSEDNINDLFIDDLLRQFAYIKPLQGIMKRKVDSETVELKKNFHDEKEWRFIPSDIQLKEKKLNKMAFSQGIVDNYNKISDNIEAPSYEALWLKFSYDDIKYIIVPNQIARINVIKFILNMPGEKFLDEMQRNVLISKIQVLDEIRKDW